MRPKSALDRARELLAAALGGLPPLALEYFWAWATMVCWPPHGTAYRTVTDLLVPLAQYASIVEGCLDLDPGYLPTTAAREWFAGRMSEELERIMRRLKEAPSDPPAGRRLTY